MAAPVAKKPLRGLMAGIGNYEAEPALAFATGGKTVGERVGYAGITQAMPP